MIDTFKFRNPYTQFIVCYPPPIWEGHPYGTTFENSHNDSILMTKIIPAIDTVVTETGAILIDFHTPFVDSIQYFPDKLHPNMDGQRIMAEILYDTILKTDLIHQVEAGLAFVSSFKQSVTPAAVSSMVELSWVTMFADSVFLDDVLADSSGSMEITAEEDKVYTLTAIGPENTSEYPLYLQTYVPEASSLYISTSSSDYFKGLPVTLYVEYRDQYNRAMIENPASVSWTIAEGEGTLSDQTDTSIVFTPVAVGSAVVEVAEGTLNTQKILKVNSLSSVSSSINSKNITVFPNPVNETLYLKAKNLPKKNVQIRVFYLLGELILEQHLNLTDQSTSTLELNTSGQNKGVYMYRVYFDMEAQYGRFVKYID